MKISRYSQREAKNDLPRRPHTHSKIEAGKSLVLAGSEGMWGAALLTAQAASRVGSGYVYLHSSSDQFPVATHPDFLFLKTLKKSNLRQFSSIAIGPGLKKSTFVRDWIENFAHFGFSRVVLDAGALRALTTMTNLTFPKSWILTPHEGELADLLGVNSEEIRQYRLEYVHLAQQIFGCIVLLKGHHTLVADDNQIFEIQVGNSALAKAGTGDVLTGMIAGLLAQGLAPIKAACLGAFVHGYTADRWLKDGNDVLSLTPLDLIEKLPKVLKKLRS